MCRLLAVKSDNEFYAEEYLKFFSLISKNSKEFQGHGWGCSFLENDKWRHYKSIKPVWEDGISGFGKTKLLIAHARSAFKDEGIRIENNMPFFDDSHVFVFNGELRGVKINSEGRIGAEKIFNFIKRFDKGNMTDAVKRSTDIINKKTSYVRAMNIIISCIENIYVYSQFNEDPDYFTMYYREHESVKIISSMPLTNESGWMPVENNSLLTF